MAEVGSIEHGTTHVIAMRQAGSTHASSAVLVIEDDQDVAMTINDVVEERGLPRHLRPQRKSGAVGA